MRNKVLVKNGEVVDGSGAASFVGDVLIVDDLIEKIGYIDEISDAYVIDASDKIITPGFIDIHRHCDYAMFKPGFGEIELSQGITTTVTGSCGLTSFPVNKEYESGLNNLLEPCLGMRPERVDFSDYASFTFAMKNIKLPLNIGSQIGSCSVRISAKGFEQSPFSKNQMRLAKNHIENAMQNGAFGLSMGIMYTPEFYSSPDELVSLAKVLKPYDGILTCHIRSEGDKLVKSVEEIISIAREAEVRLQISHFKACGIKNWGRSIFEAIEIIEKARAVDQNIGVDFYPYEGGSTTLLSLIPPAYMKESLEATWDFMSTSDGVSALEESLNQNHKDWDNYIKSLGWERVIISSVTLEKNQKFVGKNIAECVSLYGFESGYSFVCSLLSEESGKVGIIVMSMDSKDIDVIARLPYSNVISDSLYPDSGNPHPRLYGSFGKIIRDFVCGRKVLSITDAVKKMTSMPADVMGINRRGMIKEGYKADINIFELLGFKDNSSFKNSRVMCTGMDYVIINGEIAYQGGKVMCRGTGKSLFKGD